MDKGVEKLGIKIGCVVIARDEENFIENTLFSLVNQTLVPLEIILVNDNSKDATKEKALQYLSEKQIVDFPYDHENWVISGKLSRVINLGFSKLSKDLDYYLILGGDTFLPKKYLERLTENLRKTNSDLGSGVIVGEKGTIRGSGRLISKKVFELQNFSYPENYGYETYMLFKAMNDGFRIKCFENLKFKVGRTTGTFYNSEKLFHRGRSYRCLGYPFYFVVGLSILHYIKKPKFFISFLKGYLTCPTKYFYEKEIRDFTKKYVRMRIKDYLKK